MGNKETVAENLDTKFFVPLGQFGLGRVGLKPGRRGEVIPVRWHTILNPPYLYLHLICLLNRHILLTY
jgi:hypothetical protein